MFKRNFLFFFLLIIVSFTVGCGTKTAQIIGDKPGSGVVADMDDDPAFQIDGDADYNFRFVVSDTGIKNPVNDRRSYYRVFVDKVDSGRTSIGLESQNKVFESKLGLNKHLVTVNKYVLDEKKGKYVKLNNIFQPKPSFKYFDIKPDSVVVIKMVQNQQNGKAKYEIRIIEK